MKKSAKLKRKTRRLLFKNLIVFAVVIAVSVIGVRSWLMSAEDSSKANAGDLKLTCMVPDGLEVAVVRPGDSITNDTVWHSTAFTLDPEEYPFLSNVSLSEITGDGITFIRPPLTQISTVATVKTAAEEEQWSANNIRVTANSQYLSIDLYFRTAASGKKVVLGSETYCGTLNRSIDFGNSLHGWSPNSVIGAARLSVVDYATPASPARKLLWIPAPFLHFDGINLSTDNTDTGNSLGLSYKDAESHVHDIHTDGTYNHGYYYYSGNFGDENNGHKKIALNSDPTQGVTANSNKDYLLHKDVDLITLSGGTGHTMVDSGKTYNVDHVRLNIWIEGEDPESRAAQVNGKFFSELVFKLANSGT